MRRPRVLLSGVIFALALILVTGCSLPLAPAASMTAPGARALSADWLAKPSSASGIPGTKEHNKQVIGYITQWDAWKAAAAGLPSAGALTHLNIDYSQYTILNFSFFGVAQDGSLHSGDFRNKQIYQSGVNQAPSPIFYTDPYSSWDLYLLFGELELVQYINADVVKRAQAQGFVVTEGGTSWSNPTWGLSGSLPLPLHKEGGAPGLLELAHANGVKVMASIGGWSMCKHYPEMAADPAKRAKFVADCKKLINIGFDGIDFDWEYPGPFSGMNFTGSQADYANFVTLLSEVKAAIGPGKLITAAMSADPGHLAGMDWAGLDQVMDYYNFMTYDFNGGWSNKAGHNSPLHAYANAEAPTFNWDSLLAFLKSKNVNLAKANFGSPFYGRGVVTNGTAALNAPTVKRSETVQPDGPVSTCADFTNWAAYDGTPNYEYIRQVALTPGSGWTKGYDAEAGAPYLTKGNFFLSYDDADSIGLKAEFIKRNNLGGTIVWTVYGDLQFGGSVTNFGDKLKKWSDVKSPLINKINAVFAQDPLPTVTINAEAGANGTISPSGAVQVTSGRDQSFTITPNAGYAIETILVDGNAAPVQSPYTFKTVTAAHSIKASFKKSDAVQHVINASAGANGSVSPSGDTLVDKGGNLTITITPSAGYKVDKVLVDNEDKGAIASYAFTNVTAAHSLVASFVSDGNPTYPIYDPNTIYNQGDIVSWKGANWKAGWWTKGQEPGTTGEWGVWTKLGDNPAITWTINASAGANGSISPAGTTVVNDGASQTYVITAAAGYQVADVLVNNVSVGAVGSYTFNPVKANASISASFVPGTTPDVPAWAENVAYKLGDKVSYQGAVYLCKYAHTSNAAWYPGASGLWFWEKQ